MKCPNCGGDMHGDGVTEVMHCERLSASDFCAEPDANTIHCESEPHGSRDTFVPAPMDPEHRHQLRLALIGMRTAISMLLYTPETAGWLLEDKNSHHAGGVMDHLEALADSLCIVHGDVF